MDPAADPAAAGEPKPGGPPNPTVYVNNINEKIKGEKLRNGLKQVFGPYGKIRKISFRKSLKMRGQAFIVYDAQDAAEAAVAKAQNFNFYGKPLRLAFARVPSDATLKKQGQVPDRRPAHPKKGMVAVKLEKSAAKPAPAAVPAAVPFAPPAAMGYAPPYGMPPMMMPPGAAPPGAVPPAAAVPVAANGAAAGAIVPHSVLFVEELPEEATQEMLSTLFKQYAGFKDVRMVPGRACAFVDFGTEAEATVALQGLKDFKLKEDAPLKLNYARK